ncbi:hypothetical protein KR51_00007950 [Rubidibacter lacunae KORDI 51-2]|uniref:Uncharacterized protein n=1 Tax=Rubidibacter lacunae KORDI 51-2 TaxID=582515 RepID=U5DLC5_9CHRO|nr:hypothetical protein KR51_00007950 [Rubidibacter lacunae KORDI 51-2]
MEGVRDRIHSQLAELESPLLRNYSMDLEIPRSRPYLAALDTLRFLWNDGKSRQKL